MALAVTPAKLRKCLTLPGSTMLGLAPVKVAKKSKEGEHFGGPQLMKNYWEMLVPTLLVILVRLHQFQLQLASSLMCPCGCWLVFCLEYASMLKLANYHEVIRFHNSSRQTWLENPWFVDVSSSKKIGFYHYFALFHIANSERDWTYPRAVILFQWKPWRSRQTKMEPSDKWLRFQIEFVSESGIPWFLIPSWFNNPNAANKITEHFFFEQKNSSGRF